MNNTKFFLHIDPSQADCLSILQTMTLLHGSGPLTSTILDAERLSCRGHGFFSRCLS